MAELKVNIEIHLLNDPLMLQIFKQDGLFDEKNKKHLKTKVKKDKNDEYYDVDNCVIEYVSEEPIESHIHIQCFRNTMKKLEGGNVVRVCFIDSSIGNDPSTGYHLAEMKFNIINNVEK